MKQVLDKAQNIIKFWNSTCEKGSSKNLVQHLVRGHLSVIVAEKSFGFVKVYISYM